MVQDLVEILPQSVNFWAVDTACLYPMQLTARAPAKAYIFRSTTDKPRRARLRDMPYTSGSRDWANLLGGAQAMAEVPLPVCIMLWLKVLQLGRPGFRSAVAMCILLVQTCRRLCLLCVSGVSEAAVM
jgi:hypothetical protein